MPKPAPGSLVRLVRRAIGIASAVSGARSWTIGRAFLAAVTAGAVLLGVRALRDTARMGARIEEARQAVLLDLPLELRRPGGIEADLHAGFGPAHGVIVALEVSPPFYGSEEARLGLEGLALTIRLRDEEHPADPEEPPAAITGSDLVRDLAASSYPAGRFPLFGVGSTPPGHYRLSLEVRSPAGLPGRTARLVSRYELCGLEQLSATAVMAWAWSCLFLAGICGSLLAARIAGDRRRRRPFVDSGAGRA